MPDYSETVDTLQFDWPAFAHVLARALNQRGLTGHQEAADAVGLSASHVRRALHGLPVSVDALCGLMFLARQADLMKFATVAEAAIEDDDPQQQSVPLAESDEAHQRADALFSSYRKK
jgi:hypothetical protein